MTFDTSRPHEAFVWIWLPGKTAPVVAGRIHAEDDHSVFTYGRSYLARDDAIPVHAPELPLRRGAIVPERHSRSPTHCATPRRTPGAAG